jgi:hypothetical protein
VCPSLDGHDVCTRQHQHVVLCQASHQTPCGSSLIGHDVVIHDALVKTGSVSRD